MLIRKKYYSQNQKIVTFKIPKYLRKILPLKQPLTKIVESWTKRLLILILT